MIRGLFFLGIFLLLVRAGFLFTAPVVKNSMLEGKMQDLSVNRGLKSEADLRVELLDYIVDKQIDLAPEQVFFDFGERRCLIAAHYTTEVTFWKYTRRYEFFPVSSETARNKAQNYFRFSAQSRVR